MSIDKETVADEGNRHADFSTDLLRVYYGRLFPYDSMFNWLSYGNDPAAENSVMERDFFSRREWSFTIEDDIYIRYQSFVDKSELIAAIQKRQPHKIDIGAVFTAPPKEHATIKPELFKPVERELVFDIDMTDYDNIRTCCTGAEICRRCWPYMTMAVKVLDQSLRADFGFRHILWVYSGRRGVHCWVCDPEARELSNEARAAVVEYLSVEVGGGENSDKSVKSTFAHPVHPMIRRAFELLEPMFERYIADDDGQGLFARKDRYIKVLNSMPSESVRLELYNEWDKSDKLSGRERWRQLKTAISDSSASNQGNKRKRFDYAEMQIWKMELVFSHCYPRLDANVSKTQNHLLKSPFCVHPKTGRVCVPIDPELAEQFDPFSVPTLGTLCHEIDVYDSKHGNQVGKDVSDTSKTSLADAITTFDRAFMSGLAATIRRNFKDKQMRTSAMAVDF